MGSPPETRIYQKSKKIQYTCTNGFRIVNKGFSMLVYKLPIRSKHLFKIFGGLFLIWVTCTICGI
jgi:hypothetical protein